jgi:hypothetical protein
LDAVGAGKFTHSSAARHFGVRRITLSRQQRYEAVPKGTGRKQDIPPETEQELITSPDGVNMIWSINT